MSDRADHPPTSTTITTSLETIIEELKYTNNEIFNIKNELSDINSRLDGVLKYISKPTKESVIIDKIDDIKNETEKMSRHIDFIDTIYEQVGGPINSILGLDFSKRSTYTRNDFCDVEVYDERRLIQTSHIPTPPYVDQ